MYCSDPKMILYQSFVHGIFIVYLLNVRVHTGETEGNEKTTKFIADFHTRKWRMFKKNLQISFRNTKKEKNTLTSNFCDGLKKFKI